MVNPQYPTKAKGKAHEDDPKKLEDDNRVCTAIRKLPQVSCSLPLLPSLDEMKSGTA